ncbi:MAG: rhodanese-like domain-containing protein [Prolixibacteraceae bacterium]|jgi:sulfur-carrier protein adenylyltransferase/sulfurtransferase|nr:rhodanese-like domain-containing protein [Prolixibacteraceae bacterium]MBT6763216.1 rhodanese-like domain-containing protein [Prolixibacteraceae bacterium]MBT6998292.1 rhodanese-like domain-containing protein [Prolixibacteraceae bacterium]MBT7396462.1 rhodanese-like domain-containing protein [Prolixibacteraceae bacterium]
MKARLALASIIIPMGLIIAAVPENTTKPFKLTANELLEEVKSGTQFIYPDQVAEMVITKDPTLQIVDVRNADEFEKFSLPNAINIPLVDILNPEWEDYIDQDVKFNVFYSNGTNDANEAWMITRQLGYENNYVLEGGLNYWVETIMNPEAPKSTSSNEEILKYNLRKGAGMALGGAAVNTQPSTMAKSSKPPITKRKKKKRVVGGC